MTSYILANPMVRQRVIEAVKGAPLGYVVVLKEPSKSREQEGMYHAMIGEIANQCKHLNQAFDADTWKRLLVDQFKRETVGDSVLGEYWRRHPFNLIPSLDGCAMVVVGEQTRKFPKKIAMAFIDWLYAWGSDKNVKFKATE